MINKDGSPRGLNRVYKKSLDVNHCLKIHEAMANLESLAEITQEATMYRVIKYLLEDKPALEQYMSGRAGLLTKERSKISYRMFLASIFHANWGLNHCDKEFQTMLKKMVEKEQEIQITRFISENHLQVDINSNLWKMCERHGDTITMINMDFTLINRISLRYELKLYFRHVFEYTGRITAQIFRSNVLALNALAEINHNIKYYADISESDARAMVLFLENTYRKKNGGNLSQMTVSMAVNNVRQVITYLMNDIRDSEIRTPKPYMNPFANISFRNQDGYKKPTAVIPEDVIEQINKHTDELPPVYKLLYGIFINTGLRSKEVFFLEDDCVEESRYNGIFQLKFKPYKVLSARRRRGVGDCHRVMITQPLADEINFHIESTAQLRVASGSPYIFKSQKPGYSKSLMSVENFILKIRNIITRYDIRDDNGDLWHFTSKQFRKTVAVTLIENGATTHELAYWLGHMSSSTAAKYYAEVRKMKLAELNTKFFKEKFDLVLSGEQLEKYTEEERRLLYIDFRLEQRRVELGYCLVKAADGGCSNRSSLYNCVNCKNLCTGKKYLPYWNNLLNDQKDIVGRLLRSYRDGDIDDYIDFAEYKQEFRLLQGYENIVAAINEGGGLHD
jgi:integrase